MLNIVWLVACEPSSTLSDDLQDYQQRMARVLKKDNPPFINRYLPDYPPLKELGNTAIQTSIQLSEFYQLQHCQLASLVAQRNSVLGKVQLPSTRFIYEKQLIQSLQTCINDTSNTTLREKLQSWLQTKQQALPEVWAEMLQKSTETRKALASNQGWINADAQNGLAETLAALEFLLASEQQTITNNKTLEQHLHNIAAYALPAKLWRSQLLLADNIKSTTQWLKQQGATKFCQTTPQLINAQQVEYLHNVFQLFFVEKIQPIASQINNYHYKLSPLFDVILAHPALSAAFKFYIGQQYQQGFTDYQQTMKEHIELWQQIFKHCDIAPGNNIKTN